MAFEYLDKNKKSRLLFNFFLIRIGISFIVFDGIISFLRKFTTILIILIFLRIARIFVLNSKIISIVSVRIRKLINIFSISTILIAINIFNSTYSSHSTTTTPHSSVIQTYLRYPSAEVFLWPFQTILAVGAQINSRRLSIQHLYYLNTQFHRTTYSLILFLIPSLLLMLLRLRF
jgi:hypothetical protein